MLMVLITEQRNPYTHEFKPELKKGLWCLGVKRPEADKKLLEEASFNEICLMERINIRHPTLLEYLKSGYQEKAFLIEGD